MKKTEDRRPEWAVRSHYGLFAMSDGEQHLEVAMSVCGESVKNLASLKEDDFLRLLSMANTVQSLLLKKFFRRNPEKESEMNAFMAKGGEA